MSQNDIHTVAVREAQEVQPGDVIWAQDDGDWFKVARVDGKFQPTFYRADNSLVEFNYDDSKVLVRI